jgi:tetratricopeptide (TPR) repeat protein
MGWRKEAANLVPGSDRARCAGSAAPWPGLGEAEYALADYAAARDALTAALRLNPNDTAVQKRLDAAAQILALDPMRRGLSASGTLPAQPGGAGRGSRCAGSVFPAAFCRPITLKGQMEAARRLLVKGRRPPSYSDAAENNTSMAEQLWTAGAQACGSMPPADTPLSRIMARLMAR